MSYSDRFSKCCVYRQVTAILFLLFTFSSVHAELILTSPPRESATAGVQQYGPLAARLSEVLGEKVIYKQSKGWLFYQREMRADEYDIIFDGPHFISWRMKQFGHKAVAMLPGSLVFVVVTEKGTPGFYQTEITSLQDLVNEPVCALAPPNLAAMTVLAQYKNPVSLPRLITGKGGMPWVYKAFKKGVCKAAILRVEFYANKVSEEDKAGLNVIFKSKPIANQGVSASSRVSDEQLLKIRAVLTEGGAATAGILKRFAPKAEKMLPAENADYEGFYNLLTGVVFGWEIDEPLVKETLAKEKH